MLFADPGSPPLTQLGDGDVAVLRLEMGELTVHASLPDEFVWRVAAERGPDLATVFGGDRADFSSYYQLLGPLSSLDAFSLNRAQPGVSSQVLRRAWPWQRGLLPFLFMTHSYDDKLCPAVDGAARHVTEQALGLWMGDRIEEDPAGRAVERPVVLLTCSKSARRQALADAVGRLVYFPVAVVHVVRMRVEPRDPDSAVLVFFALEDPGHGRGGEFGSVYPRGPAGDRVRSAYRRRFAPEAHSWLVEHAAMLGSAAPAGVHPRPVGGGGWLGRSYFDRRDHASRAPALQTRPLGSTFAVWRPDDAYRPGGTAPHPAGEADGAVAGGWLCQAEGEVPFDPDQAVVVVVHFAHGRFAVFDERSDISYWETPEEFGLRLGRDVVAARADAAARGQTVSRVVLLTDFDAVPP